MKEILQKKIYKFILSSPQDKDGEFKKIVGELLLKNGKEVFFVEKFSMKNQAFHQHIDIEKIAEFFEENFPMTFKQLEVYDESKIHSFRAAKKRILSNKRTHKENFTPKTVQNRQKNYILNLRAKRATCQK